MPNRDREEIDRKRLADPELALATLASLVRADYPSGKRLAEIAYGFWHYG